MEVYKILMIVISLLFIFSAGRKIVKGMSFEQYSIGRSFFLWLWFVVKLIFILYTILFCINWDFLNYKI